MCAMSLCVKEFVSQNTQYNRFIVKHLEKIVGRVFFNTHNLFFKPSLLPTFEDNEAVFCFDHQFGGFPFQFFQLHRGQFAFKNRVLNPCQVSPTEFQHLANPFFAAIVNQNYIHLPINFKRFIGFVYTQNESLQFVTFQFD